MWWWVAGLAQAACPGPTQTLSVLRHVEAAELAFVDLDDERMRLERERALQATLCLGEVIHAPHAAALLRLEGMLAFSLGNEAFAIQAFRSALSVQPAFPLKAAIAPVGGPLHRLYAHAQSQPATLWALPPTPRLLFVNGSASLAAPTGVAVIQVVEPDGRLSWTGFVTQPGELPPWIGAPISNVGPTPSPVPQPALPQPVVPQPVLPQPTRPDLTTVPPVTEARRPPPRVPLLAAAGVSLAASGGLYAGSLIMRGRYESAPTEARRLSTNLQLVGSLGAGILSLGLATTAIALPGERTPRESDEGFLY